MILVGLVDKFWHLSDNISLFNVRNPEVIDYIYKITQNQCIITDNETYEENKNNDIFKKRNFIVGDIEEIKNMLHKTDKLNFVVIGKENLYNGLLEYCNRASIIKSDKEFRSTSYFPQLINIDHWKSGFGKELDKFEETTYTIERYYNSNSIKGDTNGRTIKR